MINKPDRQAMRDYLLPGLILASVLWSLIVLWPHLIDKYRVAVDVQNHYWMALFQNPSLFSRDPLLLTERLIPITMGGFDLILYPRSLGYGLLIWAGSFLIDPLWMVNFLWLLLLPVSVFFLYRYGEFLKNRYHGIYLVIIFVLYTLASPDSLSLASGLQRAFQLPLIIGFLYCQLRKKPWQASVVVILSALFYFPVLPVLLITYLLSVSFSGKEHGLVRKIRALPVKVIFPFVLFSVLSAGLAFWAITSSSGAAAPGGSIPLAPDGFLLHDPRHQAGGVAPIYLHFPWIGRAGIFESYPEAVIILVMLISSGVVYFSLPRRARTPIPDDLWMLSLAGLVMFLLANLSLFLVSTNLFYMPSRYLRCPLFLIAVFAMALNADDFLQVTKKWLASAKLLQIYLWCIGLFGLTVLITMVVFGFTVESIGWSLLITWGVVLTGGVLFWVSGRKSLFGPGFDQTNSSIAKKGLWGIGGTLIFIAVVFYSRLVGYGTINPSQAERELYAYLETLPEDIILAGSPEELTEIPLFAKRAVLIRDLRPGRSTPVLENFQAYYADEPGVVAAFCKRYQVDYLLINQNDFSKEYLASRDYFYQPYNAKILSYLEDKQDFLLPSAESVFASGPLRLIPCSGEVLKD